MSKIVSETIWQKYNLNNQKANINFSKANYAYKFLPRTFQHFATTYILCQGNSVAHSHLEHHVCIQVTLCH